MGKWVLAALVMFLAGCSQITSEDLGQLNGYWEIKKVTFRDGSHKEYSVNTTIDYISLTGTRGYRKKVSPKLDGSFETSSDAEEFTILKEEGDFIMKYENNLSSWSEKLERLSNTDFSVVNEENITYHYSRFEPFTTK